ncbi:MAG: DUF1893 domain-containing protein [Clostridia bacterium]|nr:DUF1893 domain-containing protein [Clostridia bacterium]
MTDSLQTAINTLKEGGHTCVCVKNNKVFTFDDRGIKPIVYSLREDPSFFENAYVADKVIGKAAAMLLCFGKINSLYAGVISEPALSVLIENNVNVSYGAKVPLIKNRDNTGMCPMETRALDVDNLNDAYVLFDEIVK